MRSKDKINRFSSLKFERMLRKKPEKVAMKGEGKGKQKDGRANRERKVK